MPNPTGFTPAEKLALNQAESLVRRAMQDDTSLEVFNLALANYNFLTDVVIASRRDRNTKKKFINRLFNK